MKFKIDPKIFEKFPEVVVGAVVVKGADNSGKGMKIEKLLREQEIQVQLQKKHIHFILAMIGSLHQING